VVTHVTRNAASSSTKLKPAPDLRAPNQGCPVRAKTVPTRYTSPVSPSWLAVAAAAIPAVIALTGWVVRALVIDRLRGLEESRVRLGERVGQLEAWRQAHEAVMRDRRRRDTRGVVADEDSTP